MVRKLADRITASPDLFPQRDREPNRSINFVTCHDGFTLNDLVAYNRKRNDANGHTNTDGTDANFSWNCGDEGPTKDRKIEALRYRQMKNLVSILLVSQGTPMLLMGDEVRRTQRGNNNAYCQDNETSWLDWRGVQLHADMLRFVKGMIRFNREHRLFQEERFWMTEGSPDVIWHGIHLYQPDWGDASHSLAFELLYPEQGEHLHIMLNAYWEPLTFELPALPPEQRWRRVVDTALPSPDDISEPGKEPPVAGREYRVEARSVVILLAR
jgi:glycogen operon protein